MTRACQCGCGRLLTWRQEKFASRACAGRGLTPAQRALAGARGGRTKGERHWAAMLRELAGCSIEEKVRTAYWRGYSKGKRQRQRAEQERG